MGVLVLIATPIGNLGDLSPRAVTALQGASLICCEDTRRTGKLLSHLGIRGVPMAISNEHTESDRIEQVLNILSGGTVAVVTDAGTPGISDPGERLVRAAIEHNHTVSAIPGPSADVMALVISGLPTARYVFDGFIARRGAERAQRLQEVAREMRTVVLYEAPHRLERTLVDLREVCGGERRIVLARELTKIHEEVWRGTLDTALPHVRARTPMGEYVLVLEGGSPAARATDNDIVSALQRTLATGTSKKAAVAAVAQQLKVPKNRVYELALGLAIQPRGTNAS